MSPTFEAAFTYLELGACAVAWVPILAASSFVHRHDEVPRYPGRWLRRFGRATSALTPLWHFDVRGEAPADVDRRAYVVVANHASSADPFLLSWLPWDMQWVAKAELFRVPLFGAMLRLGGDIPLRRGDGESVRAMLSSCRHALKNGLSVMIFPEGTRSPDGGLGRFKDGAFRLAVAEHAPILPIAVKGTQRCLPKDSFRPGRAHATARILAPIETRGMNDDDVPRARDLARERIRRGLESCGDDMTYDTPRTERASYLPAP